MTATHYLFFWFPAGSSPAPAAQQSSTGGWENWRNVYRRQQTKDEIRRERERLGIVPRQAKKIERLAEKLVDEIDAYEPSAIVAQITAAQEFKALLDALARKDAERRQAIAEFAASMILAEIMAARDAEEEAIVRILIEM